MAKKTNNKGQEKLSGGISLEYISSGNHAGWAFFTVYENIHRDFKSILSAFIHLSSKNQSKKIIINVRPYASSRTVFEEFDLVVKLSFYIQNESQIAILACYIDNEDVSFIKRRFFLEKVIFLAVFREVNEAIQWLEGSDNVVSDNYF